MLNRLKAAYDKQNSYLKRDSITAIPLDRVTHTPLNYIIFS
jgi:hypothetical protein